MKTVVYLTCTKLPCVDVSNAPIVLCLIDDVSLVSGRHTISAILTIAQEVFDECNRSSYWRYTATYDETSLSDPTVILKSTDITGLFCETCFTEWIREVSTECSTHVSTYEELLAAVDAGLAIVICNAITLEDAITLTAPLTMGFGGSIVTDGNVLTINGALRAGTSQIFVAGNAEVVFGPNAVREALLEWFGAIGDGTTDDTVAVQLAINTCTVFPVYVPIRPLNKTYSIGAINCPRQTKLISVDTKRSTAIFKARSAVDMFTVTNLSDAFVKFEGIAFDFNGLATAAITISGTADNVYIEECSFRGTGVRAIKLNGGVFIHIRGCEFTGTCSTAIITLTSAAIAIYINENNFSGTAPFAIMSDSSWTGDGLVINQNTFGTFGATDIIQLLRNTGSTGQVHFFILANRFDGVSTNSIIKVGQKNVGVIRDNSITDNCLYGVTCDGDFVSLRDNFFAQSTSVAIQITSNAQDCAIGSQKWGSLSSGSRITDAGSRTVIDNQQQIKKGTTAQRPSGIVAPSATQYGLMYMDTTLDPDGKPIWWNGVAWLDATGAVV